MHAALAVEIKKCLELLATPVEAGLPVRAGVGVVTIATDFGPRLRYQAYWGHDGMRRREYFGPNFDYPRDADAFVKQVNERAGFVDRVPA